MDHAASECVMVGRVGGWVKQMSRAGDEICLLLSFFSLFFFLVSSVILVQNKSGPSESSRISEKKKSLQMHHPG